jgi:hypothetical protein
MSIDIVLFILLVSIAGIGFLMKFVLVPGEVRNEIYGNNVDLEFFGLTRHEWGSIHLIISIIFLAFLVLHTIFHWKLIVSIFKCMFPARFVRYGITGIICLISLLTLISPFFVKPEIVPFEPKYRNRTHSTPSTDNNRPETTDKEIITAQPFAASVEADSASNIPQKSDLITHEGHHNSEYSEFEVYGYQTLQYVADRYKVPAAIIARDLNIPENLTGEKLVWLRKRYSFTMTDVRKSISDYKKHNN